MRTKLISDENNTVYLLTSKLGTVHFGMIATWIVPASLRQDEARFSLVLSKFNHTAEAILQSEEFILHELNEEDFNLAFIFGSSHSKDIDKFKNIRFYVHESGIRILEDKPSFAYSKVLNKLETEDRIILYCSSKQFKINSDNRSLTQKRLFEQLDSSSRDVLSLKYQSDCERDRLAR